MRLRSCEVECEVGLMRSCVWMENTFLDLVPFLLGLDIFHGLYMTLLQFLLEMAALLLFPHTLLDLRTLPLELAPPQTTPPLDRFSKRLDRALPCNMAGSISIHCVVSAPPYHAPLFSIFTFHTFSGLCQLRRGSTWWQPG